MLAFRPMTLSERVKRALSPSYRQRMEAETKAAIRELVAHPERPCVIGDELVPDGYGVRQSGASTP